MTNTSRTWSWLRLAAGVSAMALGVVAFAWPEATLRVVAFLFGLNLLLMGATRILQMLIARELPALHRVAGVLLGLLVLAAGVLCLGDIAKSLGLLLLIVAIGWILDGLGEIVLAARRGTPGGGWRIALGVGVVLAAVAVLVWPGLGLAGFLLVGASMLVFAGICLVFSAIAGLRAPRAA
jgi:uncharacterized membrane protein HdeD (DUF308 family)